VGISGVGDDGIQVEVKDSTAVTGTTTDHEDEDSGNLYMTDGTLTISNYGGYPVQVAGTATYSGGTQNFDTTASIIAAKTRGTTTGETRYDLGGRQQSTSTTHRPGFYIIRKNNHTIKSLER